MVFSEIPKKWMIRLFYITVSYHEFNWIIRLEIYFVCVMKLIVIGKTYNLYMFK